MSTPTAGTSKVSSTARISTQGGIRRSSRVPKLSTSSRQVKVVKKTSRPSNVGASGQPVRRSDPPAEFIIPPVPVEASSNWTQPVYSNKQWFEDNCRQCKICETVFTSREEAMSCFFTLHHNYRRQCLVCFTLLSLGPDPDKLLFMHYDHRHRNPGDEPSTLRCPYCSDTITYDSVSMHMISTHYYLPYPNGTHPLVTAEAARFLREIKPADPRFKYHLASGTISAEMIDASHDDFGVIHDYVNNGQVHETFGVKLLQVLKISRNAERTRLPYTPQIDNRVVLWHGTRTQNIVGILTKGFTIPVASRQMFGTGIYFADRISKSARYCWNYAVDPPVNWEGYLFLCEVQLGRSHHATDVDHSLISAPASITSRQRMHVTLM